jgi:hypothetical protein
MGQESLRTDLLIFLILPKLVTELTGFKQKNYQYGCCYREKSEFMAYRQL